MKKAIIFLVIGIIGTLYSIFSIWPLADITDLVSSQAQVMIKIGDPYQLLQRIVNSEMVNKLNTRGIFKGDAQQLVNKVRQIFYERGMFSAFLLKVKKIYLVFPEGFSKDHSGNLQAAVLFDLGSSFRFLQLAYLLGFRSSNLQTMDYQGHSIFSNGETSLGIIRGFMVFGTSVAVQEVFDCLDNRRTAVSDAPKIYQKGLESADPEADLNMLILSRLFLTPMNPQDNVKDPRWLFLPDAFEGGAANLYLDPASMLVKAVLHQVAGKSLLPYTKAKGGPIESVKLVADHPLAFLALRLDRTAQMTQPLMTLLSNNKTPSGIRKKVSEVALSAFLQKCSDEAAVIYEDIETKIPIFAVLADKQNEIGDLLNKMSITISTDQTLAPEDVDKTKTKIEELLGVKLDFSNGLEKAIENLSSDQKKKVKEILEAEAKVKEETATGNTGDNVVKVFGTNFHYGFIGDYLVMALERKSFEKMKAAFSSGSGGLPDEIKPFVDVDGAALGLFHLKTKQFNPDADDEQYTPIGISIKEASGQVLVKAGMPIPLGLAPKVRPSFGARLAVDLIVGIIYLPIIFFMIIAAFGLRRFLRLRKTA